MRQMQIDFQPGLVEQFPEFRDVVRASVYDCGRAFKTVAADLDMSVSELSRKLADNPADPVHFPLHRLPELVKATGDLRPVYWLIESFLEDPDAKKHRVISEAAGMVKRLTSLLDGLERTAQ
ncbi:MAG TPA: phage regulatory CII family protein [Burkholderiales bacterium]|nr:phage regulatory CII family protein [Burkholderiales bacterium]